MPSVDVRRVHSASFFGFGSSRALRSRALDGEEFAALAVDRLRHGVHLLLQVGTIPDTNT
jgi:hypothetical protein